jgi:tetratricopeptide (TPR) repeat protein
MLTGVAIVRGRLADAERERARFVEIGERRGNRQSVLGSAAGHALDRTLLLGDTLGARRILAEATARLPLDSLDPLERPYVGLAGAYALSGDRARAAALRDEYLRVTPKELQSVPEPRLWMDGYIALADRRTADAVAAFRAIRATGRCKDCGWYEEGMAWEAAGQLDSAQAAFEHVLTSELRMNSIIFRASRLPQTHRRLGALYEARGDTAKAIEQYTVFLDLWREADPELQPQVRDVKERLGRMVGEKGR